jgi:hypothetical protein
MKVKFIPKALKTKGVPGMGNLFTSAIKEVFKGWP